MEWLTRGHFWCILSSPHEKDVVGIGVPDMRRSAATSRVAAFLLADVWDRETRPHKGEAHYAHPLKLPLWVRLAGSFGRPFLIAVRQPAILPTTLIGVSEKV